MRNTNALPDLGLLDSFLQNENETRPESVTEQLVLEQSDVEQHVQSPVDDDIDVVNLSKSSEKK